MYKQQFIYCEQLLRKGIFLNWKAKKKCEKVIVSLSRLFVIREYNVLVLRQDGVSCSFAYQRQQFSVF